MYYWADEKKRKVGSNANNEKTDGRANLHPHNFLFGKSTNGERSQICKLMKKRSAKQFTAATALALADIAAVNAIHSIAVARSSNATQTNTISMHWPAAAAEYRRCCKQPLVAAIKQIISLNCISISIRLFAVQAVGESASQSVSQSVNQSKKKSRARNKIMYHENNEDRCSPWFYCLLD
uniref:Uncharacterized protein n=1 Tax=Glossina brevipalpis TaxID=37001 RepID=A0A1A9WY89_9MUSC